MSAKAATAADAGTVCNEKSEKKIAKKEALVYLASEREKIMRMSHNEALKELIKSSKIENKIKIINKISDNGLFGLK